MNWFAIPDPYRRVVESLKSIASDEALRSWIGRTERWRLFVEVDLGGGTRRIRFNHEVVCELGRFDDEKRAEILEQLFERRDRWPSGPVDVKQVCDQYHQRRRLLTCTIGAFVNNEPVSEMLQIVTPRKRR